MRIQADSSDDEPEEEKKEETKASGVDVNTDMNADINFEEERKGDDDYGNGAAAGGVGPYIGEE